jgi:mitochondrial import inner membrane translocase subunit TIM22
MGIDNIDTMSSPSNFNDTTTVPSLSSSSQQPAQQPAHHSRSIPQRRTIYEIIMSRQQHQQQQQQQQQQQLAVADEWTYHQNSPYSHTAALHRPITTSTTTTTTTTSINSNNATTTDHHPLSIEQITQRSLPYFLPWSITASPNSAAHIPPDYTHIANSCGGKAAIGVFGGGVMGLLMGVFLGAMSDATPPVQYIAGKEVPSQPLHDQMKLTFRATANKSLYWCKNFAFITGVFGGSECLVEKYRGKHDVWNSVVSGCLTGAALQGKTNTHS